MNEVTTAPTALEPELLEEVLRNAPDGVAVVEYRDKVTLVAYGNATLAALLRRPEEWLVDRLLDDVELETPGDPSATVAAGTTGTGMRVKLRRVDGVLVDCERWALMMPGGRVALYYRAVPRNAAGALAAAVERLSGLSTEEHLLDLLGRDWSIGQRDGRTVTLMHFEIDGWSDYREVFGRSASDNVLRQVGRTIATITKRASDVVAKTDNDNFLVLGVAMEADCALGFAEQIVMRIRALSIHHPRSPSGRFLSVSVGVVTACPPRGKPHDVVVAAAARALNLARSRGGNRAVSGEL